MADKSLGSALQGMGAWFSGKGPQYENAKTLARQVEQKERLIQQESDQRLLAQRQAQAKGLTDRMYSMYKLYGPQGAMQVIEGLQSEVQGTPLAPALNGYANLLQEGMARQDLSAFEMELTDDYVKLGGKVEQEKPNEGVTMYSAKTENLPGGYTKLVDRDGNIALYGPDNQQITDPAAMREAMKEVQRYAAEMAGGKAKSVEDAKNTSKTLESYFERSQNLRFSLGDYDEVVRLVDAGAETGVIASMLPSFRAQSQKLDQLQRQMGLDVIRDTTFGALSEGERKMAMQAGLPTSMSGDTLKEWAMTRKAINQKVIDYLDWAITILDQPGMSVAKFKTAIKKGEIEEPDFGYNSIDRSFGRQPVDLDLTK